MQICHLPLKYHHLLTCRILLLVFLQCLRPPYGVLYLAARKNYIGTSSAVRQLRALVDEEGIFGVHLVSEPPEREIWKFFFK
jgi:hypothetical protein